MEQEAPPQAQEPQQQLGWRNLLSAFVKQMLFFYFVSSTLRTFFPGNSTTENGTGGGNLAQAANFYQNGQFFDVWMFLDEKPTPFTDFSNPEKLFASQFSIEYGNWETGATKDATWIFAKTLPTPASLHANQSIFLHVFIVRSGQNLATVLPDDLIYANYRLNKFKKRHFKKTVNLLTGESAETVETQRKLEQGVDFEVLNHWHPNISVNLVYDQSMWAKGSLPSPMDEDLKFNRIATVYRPPMIFNNYWNLGAEYFPINSTVPQINLTVTFYPLSLMKYQMYSSQRVQQKWKAYLPKDVEEEDDDSQDSIKQALLDTNPVLLAITFTVSILHSIFEFLAFKNDIQFWKERKNLAGLSVRSVLFNIFQSLIVFLYICDNETNYVVKISVGVGLLIECWKIPKVLDIKLDHTSKILGIFPKIKFSDKGTYIESETRQFDEMAFKYLGMFLFPCLLGYAIYSLIYLEQKGWYSWLLNMFYGYLLTFGFITMTPQLFINYKLKSVAHLPWRMLTYKFINTFIDDLFAFVIKMPWLYRIGCFRDDIIFLIYLYQKWIYRVDYSRTNEFGGTGENAENPAEILAENSETPSETKKNQ
ncbi:unnamed protein product [Caenorhabditis angaria]|uniref:Uncharacterized protein n=1 Tax=Caenorhabditis angaria TaxID=860376 RepID=A0A9P1IFF0_9PELO|nr:unnamed protein product [Caenorhabditis angaria]